MKITDTKRTNHGFVRVLPRLPGALLEKFIENALKVKPRNWNGPKGRTTVMTVVDLLSRG